MLTKYLYTMLKVNIYTFWLKHKFNWIKIKIVYNYNIDKKKSESYKLSLWNIYIINISNST
jgi:hypothetical protein